MPIIHKVVEGGGEQYLGWALARERALRGQGGNRSIKYDLGDAEVEIRVVGNQSFIFTRDVDISNIAWIGVFCRTNFHFSNANNWGRLKVDMPELPKPPDPLPTPPPYVGSEPPTYTPAPLPVVEFGGGPVIGDTIIPASMSDAEKRGYTAAIAQAVAANYDAQVASGTPPDQANTSNTSGVVLVRVDYENPVSDGAGFLIWTQVLIYEFREENSSVPYYEYVSAYRDWDEANRQAEAEYLAAYYAPYIEAVAAHNDAVAAILIPWAGADACMASVGDLFAMRRAQRNVQMAIAASEQDMGLTVLPVFTPSMRPEYIPVEQPTQPYPHTQGSSSLVNVPATGACGDAGMLALDASGLYTTDASAGIGAAVMDLSVRTDRAFGYYVSGVIPPYALMPAASSITTANAAGYEEWIAGAKSAGSRNVDFDLLGASSSASAYVFFFEYDAWDSESAAWYWTPSLSLLNVNAGVWCRPECDYKFDEYYNQHIAPIRPQQGAYVRGMRLRKALKHSQSGMGWNPPSAFSVSADEFNFDIPDGLGDGLALPDFITVFSGIESWKAPEMWQQYGLFPTASTSAFIDDTTRPIKSAQWEFVVSLYKACMDACRSPK